MFHFLFLTRPKLLRRFVRPLFAALPLRFHRRHLRARFLLSLVSPPSRHRAERPSSQYRHHGMFVPRRTKIFRGGPSSHALGRRIARPAPGRSNVWRGDKILATVEIAKETPLYAPDLRGISLENANLAGADLRHANLAGVSLRGARLREAILDHANLESADLTYTDLTGATLNNTNLDGTIFYPCQMPKRAGALYGAKFSPSSEV